MTRTTDMQPATIADAAAIASIAHALREEPNTSLPPGLDTEMARAWLTRIAASGAAAIALDGSIPVAFGRSRRARTSPRPASSASGCYPTTGAEASQRNWRRSCWRSRVIAASGASGDGSRTATSPPSASSPLSAEWFPCATPT